MKILIINPILYTSENRHVKKSNSIMDTMIYSLCLAFIEAGHQVTLYASDKFKPVSEEDYPFEIIWGKTVLHNIFLPNCFPFMPDLITFLMQKEQEYDFIISKEVFSMSTFITVLRDSDKVIIWHELAKHNNLIKKLPSKFWYNIIARWFYSKSLVVPCSYEAMEFISHYCRRVFNSPLDHGVNLNKFQIQLTKKRHFVVCSQLIKRKRIDGILINFKEYLELQNPAARLYIIGEGEEEGRLRQLTSELKLDRNVIFTGKLDHREMIPYLSNAMALLINTEKDNNMISIIESIAVATPVITTKIPYNAEYIEREKLGIAKNNWNSKDMQTVVKNNGFYVQNCLAYRGQLSAGYKVKKFLELYDRLMSE